MGWFNRLVTITTDSNSEFSFKDQLVNSDDSEPESDGLNLVMTAKLKSPKESTARCSFIFGNGSNEAREFTLQAGQEVELGSWHVGQGKVYSMEISGKIEPPHPNAKVEVDLQATG